MAGVLTKASVVQCAEGAPASTGSDAKLTVSGAPVLTSAGIPGWTFVGCPQSTKGGSAKSCTGMVAQQGGGSQKLTVAGSPAVLETIAGKTDGAPLNTVVASHVQTKLTAS
ncbi:MAG TPA: hypothetical protein VF245_06895 [Solirubrobacterales bacterium]